MKRNTKGKNNANYKDGRMSKKYFCIDCGKKISISSGLYGKKRCKSCSKKGKLNNMHNVYLLGNKNGNYKKGITLKIHHCKKCNRIISYYLWKYKEKQCLKCGGNLKGKYYKNIWMRSSWEYKYAKYLDKNKIKWLYEPCEFKMLINNKKTIYKPDFYLSQSNKFIEIKGWWRDDAKEKFRLFKKLYPKIKIKVLNGEVLKQSHII